jgi:hypothetical protein
LPKTYQTTSETDLRTVFPRLGFTEMETEHFPFLFVLIVDCEIAHCCRVLTDTRAEIFAPVETFIPATTARVRNFIDLPRRILSSDATDF